MEKETSWLDSRLSPLNSSRAEKSNAFIISFAPWSSLIEYEGYVNCQHAASPELSRDVNLQLERVSLFDVM
jgi:hypothetical protein